MNGRSDVVKNFENTAVALNLSMREIDRPFSVRSHTILHPSYGNAIKKISSIHIRGCDHKHGGGLMLTGHSGVGKSMVLAHYKEKFPKFEESDGGVIPVLLVVTPAAPTVKNLAESILEAMDDPFSSRGTSEDKTRRIYLFLKKCRVELIMIDEFQHFAETGRKSEARTVTDWLKNLLSVTKIPVVLAGMPNGELVIRSNPQLARRFSSRHYLMPFSVLNDDAQSEFRGVLKGIHSKIPIDCIALHDANIARKIFIATNGVMDYICKLIDQAFYLAQQTAKQEITLEILRQAFLDEIWIDCPEPLNPFSVTPALRPLMQSGEPFESHAASGSIFGSLYSKKTNVSI